MEEKQEKKVAVLPTGVRFSLTRNEHEATFNYEEDFDDVALVARTVDMIVHVLPDGLAVELINDGKTARIHGTCDYSIIAEMIANEFIHWSRIGEMKLRDILLLGTVAQAQNAKTEKALDTIQEGLGAIFPPLPPAAP